MMSAFRWKNRSLSFVTGLLVLLILVFFMSRLLPGEMMLSENAESKKGKVSLLKQQIQREVIFRKMGYHLPLFYFTLESMAVPDSFGRMADSRFAKTLNFIAYQSGNPASAYALCSYIRNKHGVALPFKTKNARWTSRIELKEINNFLLSDSRVQHQIHKLNEEMASEMWKRYVPVVRFSLDNQFHRWLFGKPDEPYSGLIHGNFGKSAVRGQYVVQLIKFPVLFSVCFSVLICLFSIPLGLWMGSVMAASPRLKFVRFLMNVFLFYYNMPVFVAAIGSVFLFANPHMLNILPSTGPLLNTSGSVWDWLASLIGQWNYLILPLLVLSASSVFYIAQLTCEIIWAEYEKPYALTLRSKGFSGAYIMKNQLLSNAKIPVYVTMISVFPALVSGSLLLDYFFSLNGLGSILVQAHATKDIPLIAGAFLVSGVISMLSFIFSDYWVSIIDPRASLKNVKSAVK